MDYGLTEHEFWTMTLAEVIRAVDCKKRTLKREAQERASMDYILADLIGRSVARIHSSSNQLPHISQVYPSLFDSEEVEQKLQEKRDEASVARFKQFAESHNAKFKGGSKENE